MIVRIREQCGEFAENKDDARKLRELFIVPAIAEGQEVVLDFAGVDASTQSFLHALISQILQDGGEAALAKLRFMNCNGPIKSLVRTVVNYSLE